MATTSEDFIASDSAEGIEPNVSDDLNCTLCMKIFRSPRALPCSHSFCHDCLQSHISQSASVKDTLKEFSCPVCETSVRLGEDIAVDKWVYSFPLNTLLLSVLIKLKVKVDIGCDICQVLDATYHAKNICIVCEQALCENCSKVHKYLRYSNTHDILKVDELPSRQDIVLKHNSMFKCADHAQNHLDRYCKTHDVQLCSKCFKSKHKSCSEVFDVNNETPNVSDILNDVKVQIKQLEDQYKRFTDINVSNLRDLDSQTQQMGQTFQAGEAGFFVPTVPQAAQRDLLTSQTMPQMGTVPRWPTVRPSHPAAQSGFKSLSSGPQVRPAHPAGTAQYNMRTKVNVRAITGPNTTQPRVTKPVTHIDVPGRPSPSNVPPQHHQRQLKLSQQRSMRIVSRAQQQHYPPQAVFVHGHETLTSQMLDSAPPQEQKQMLGERLFPLIQRMYPDLAGKITGMLLDMEGNSELLHMLESSESLKAKVDEAVALLEAHQAKEAATQQTST